MTEETGKFEILHFSHPDEEQLFSERNAKLLQLLPTLNDALDNVFSHTVMGDRQGLTVFMLGRRCSNDFAEILLLASNGYGFAALQVLRSMFEKLVEATYLHRCPEQVDAIWDYYFVELEKLGYQDIAGKLDPDWEAIVAKFKKLGKKNARTQPRWSKHNLVQTARDIGLGDLLHSAYYLPNLFVHNSIAEILFSLEEDSNGRFTPVDFNNPSERRMADVAVHQSLFLLLKILELEIQHYGWKDSEPAVQKYLDQFGSYLQSSKSDKVG